MGDSEDRVPGNVGSVVVSTVGPDGAWVEAVHPQSRLRAVRARRRSSAGS